MKFTFFIASLAAFLVRQSSADVTFNLVKGILDGKIQPVYDALLQKANAGFVVTSNYLNKNNLPLPWESFTEAPVLHFAMGGGTEAYFRIANMLLAGGADPNIFTRNYPPAILFALGYGRMKTNEDMAATIQGVFADPKNARKFDIANSLTAYHTLMNHATNPTVLEYTISTQFAHGMYALLSSSESTNIDINQHNAMNLTALHYAAYYGYTSFIDVLLMYKQLDLFAVDAYGRTALHYAILRGHLPVVNSLLNNTDATFITRAVKKRLLTVVDNNSHNILDLALMAPVKVDIVQFLLPLYQSFYISIMKLSPQLSSLKLITDVYETEDDEEEEEDWASPPTITLSSNNKDNNGATLEEGVISNVQSFSNIHSESVTFSVLNNWYGSDVITQLEAADEALNKNEDEMKSTTEVTASGILSTKSTASAADFIPLHQVDMIHSTNISKELFLSRYLNNQNPVLITGNLTGGSEIWSKIERNTFENEFKDTQMYTTNLTTGVKMRMTMSAWMEALTAESATAAEQATLAEQKGQISLGGLAQSVLGNRENNRQLSESLPHHEIFTVCSGGVASDERNNDIQLNIGGYGSGKSAHAHGNSYETLLVGRRKVILIPPGALGPRDYSWSISTHVLMQLTQLMSFAQTGSVYVVYQQPGDVLYIPAGWVHASVNFAETVTISREFCSGIVDADAAIAVPYDIYSQVYGSVTTAWSLL